MADTTYKSHEERRFLWYLDELKTAGYILKYEYEPESIILSKKVDGLKETTTKKKARYESSTLLEEHVYTFDFLVRWTDKATGIFHRHMLNNYPFHAVGILPISYVEVKGTFNANNMVRLFSLNRKWLYQTYQIFVNIVIPEKLFKKTFTPERYLLTDIEMRARKLNYTPVTLDEFVQKQIVRRDKFDKLYSNKLILK